jgi:hypothetical protein
MEISWAGTCTNGGIFCCYRQADANAIPVLCDLAVILQGGRVYLTIRIR